jgi:hypothetical protein
VYNYFIKENNNMTNFLLISLTSKVEEIHGHIKKVQKSYDALTDKSTWFASQHEKLLQAHEEALAVYTSHLQREQYLDEAEFSRCPDCGVPEGNIHLSSCSTNIP